MSLHFIDTTLFGDSVSTADMRAIFDERNMLQKWLDVEVALAKAQSAMGMIPAGAAAVIAAKADVGLLDLEMIKAHGKVSGHSLLGLLTEFRKVIDHDYSRYVHFGATTQDIIDTGMMLMIKDGVGLIIKRLRRCMAILSRIVVDHADTVMVGRTHAGHGLPITFGLKSASWLSELDRQLERWTEARQRIQVGNLSGAVGSFASWGKQGFEVQERALELLDLQVPDTWWHSSRDRIAETMTLCALLAGTAGRIGRNLYNMSRTEFQELGEPSEGKIGSSTMPHKKNPIHSEWIMVLERVVRSNTSVVLETMGQEDERDASRWKNEWIAVPESFATLSGALNHLEIVLSGLSVNKDKMLENTKLLRGMLLSEQVMFLLEKKFPLPAAHEKVYLASVRANKKGTNLIDELLDDSEIEDAFSRDEIEAVLDPARYLGLSADVARNVHKKVEARLRAVSQES